MVMHSSTLLGLLLLVATASSMALFESKAVDVPDLPAGEMDDDAQSAVLLFMKLFNPSKPKSRPQRSFQHKTCGQKVLEYTLKICDSLDIKTQSEVDISSICCSSMCSDEFIRKAMCPEKKH
ncbi:hypothetical protein L5515_014714 [Caenorhabditis briggsae]|uniref:Uncharacterized protein n=1 Tax=Caenorhabditis briggsae TaxID=6238 RepID=A0AAE9J8D6_CAEBR|nr:hypothetical protein L3Y34_018592 [Caenorhabditis briggsae]UMM18827.1 hypothetical protein L5515_014714 [Caenorhabditis briggsae]